MSAYACTMGFAASEFGLAPSKPTTPTPVCYQGGCIIPGGAPPQPTCSGLKDTANALKAIGWGGGIWAGLGKLGLVGETGGTALGVFGVAGGAGGLLGLAADYHIGCTP